MSELSAIVALLRSDLYEREPDPKGLAYAAMDWKSPLGHRVRLSGSRHSPTAQVWDASGKRLFGPEFVTAERLDAVLP